jgi:hypothetical protein
MRWLVPDLNDQEREALEEIEEIYAEGRKPPTLVERRIHEIARAGLAAREDTEQEHKR